MSNRPNANCPVSGCRTTAPHVDDATVKALMIAFAPPAEMTKWTLAAMAELAESICRDLENKKVFAFHTRVRQPEELYIRTLYTLFVASDEEPQELAVCRKPSRRTDSSDLGQLDQQLPPARDGSATLLYVTADEPSLVAGKRHRRLASRSLEKSSCCPVRGFGNTSSRFLKTDCEGHFWLLTSDRFPCDGRREGQERSSGRLRSCR
jgi:hypothetical protein